MTIPFSEDLSKAVPWRLLLQHFELQQKNDTKKVFVQRTRKRKKVGKTFNETIYSV
jgi:hypothetical protein